MPSNTEFLQAIFKDDAPFVHVTDFTFDPNNIPSDEHLRAWSGNWASRYTFTPNSNQYFTISIFNPDEYGTPRRRKALYLRTPTIVLDDVKEKLSLVEAQKLPKPSWILETSPGSEQWGYILDTPCDDRSKVENLLDGLVANGLAPSGKDPGMKGVTRYVRLPDGYNTKVSKMVDGQPYKCKMLLWEPHNTSTIESLAEPFHVNLDAPRRESRVDGAADIPDHPLLQIPDIISIKEIRSNGRFDVTCPWHGEHTGAVDNGAAIFTNDDGSMGFKCHHGACEGRTGRNLINLIESLQPGFRQSYTSWQAIRAFKEVSAPVYDFMGATVAPPPPAVTQQAPPAVAPPPVVDGLDQLFTALNHINPLSADAIKITSTILQIVDSMPAIEQLQHHVRVCDLMHWTKLEFRAVLKDLRKQWYDVGNKKVDFLTNMLYVKEQNQFYDRQSGIFMSPDGFQNAHAHMDAEARKTALQGGHVDKVDKLDFAPKKAQIFTENGVTYGNLWSSQRVPTGTPGDVTPFYDHMRLMGFTEENIKHVTQWMAFTLRHPEEKINHMLIIAGREGIGKDWLLTPLTQAMGVYAHVIEGHELTRDFNEYLLAIKFLVINETELGDYREAQVVSAKLKPLAASPPLTLSVNIKGVRPIKIRNIVNCVMTSNEVMPIRLQGQSRRFYALWSDLHIRDDKGDVSQEWQDYWVKMWNWMNNGGSDHVIYHMLNELDLSDFRAGVAPVVTDFLRDIQESSKPPRQQTIDAFIESRAGAFSSDIITSSDASNTLKAGLVWYSELMQCDPKIFTPTATGRLLSNTPGVKKVRASKNHEDLRPYVIRNHAKYADLTAGEMYDEYKIQINKVKQTTNTV
jgi:hypothetical protein